MRSLSSSDVYISTYLHYLSVSDAKNTLITTDNHATSLKLSILLAMVYPSLYLTKTHLFSPFQVIRHLIFEARLYAGFLGFDIVLQGNETTRNCNEVHFRTDGLAHE